MYENDTMMQSIWKLYWLCPQVLCSVKLSTSYNLLEDLLAIQVEQLFQEARHLCKNSMVASLLAAFKKDYYFGVFLKKNIPPLSLLNAAYNQNHNIQSQVQSSNGGLLHGKSCINNRTTVVIKNNNFETWSQFTGLLGLCVPGVMGRLYIIYNQIY